MPHLTNLFDPEGYDTKIEWPAHVHRLQFGRKGLVLNGDSTYRTAFFEAFSNDHFVRGEGETVEVAEANAYASLQKKEACRHTEYKPFGWDKSSGKCVDCGHIESNMFPSNKTCSVCGQEHVKFNHGQVSFCARHYAESQPEDEISKGLSLIARKCLEYGLFGENEVTNSVVFRDVHDLELEFTSSVNRAVIEHIKRITQDLSEADRSKKMNMLFDEAEILMEAYQGKIMDVIVGHKYSYEEVQDEIIKALV